LALLLVAVLSACGGDEAGGEVDEEPYDLNTRSYDAGSFVTNVKDSSMVLSCSFTIDVISEKLYETLQEKDYVARDVINRRLCELTEAEVRSADLTALSESLVSALNESMNTKGFYKVYIESYVYQ